MYDDLAEYFLKLKTNDVNSIGLNLNPFYIGRNKLTIKIKNIICQNYTINYSTSCTLTSYLVEILLTTVGFTDDKNSEESLGKYI